MTSSVSTCCVRAFVLLVVPILVVPYWVKVQSLRSSKEDDLDPQGEVRAKRDLALHQPATPITLFGVSVETDPEVGDAMTFGPDGVATLMEEQTVNLVLYGLFTNATKIRFAMHDFSCSVDADMEEPDTLDVVLDHGRTSDGFAKVGRVYEVDLPAREDYPRLYFCLLSEDGTWTPQGNSMGTHFSLKTQFLPTWIRLIFVICLLTLSGLFSGLSLGLMSLDKNELAILINTGTAAEKKYAANIAPIRNHGNFLLCSLLFSNVLVNASLTLLMDTLMSGVFAVAAATLAIVVFGEITPQSICSRYGLAVGSHTLFLTKFFMAITSPLAWPLSKLLDKILGEEIGAFYTRERLQELLIVTEGHHGLEKDEVQLISGALGMKNKCAGDVMTPLASVFMLSKDTKLDYAALAEIEFQAFARIPVYDKEKSNVVGLLNLKQIAQADGREAVPVGSLLDFYPNSKDLTYVTHDCHLDKVFRNFRTGKKAHMIFVTRAAEKSNQEQTTANDGSADSKPTSTAAVPGTPEVVGILTMEDVLEELLQTRILDEKDIDKLRARAKISVCTPAPPNLAKINQKQAKKARNRISIPPPMALAGCQSLSTIKAFSRTEISDTILNRLIKATVRRSAPPKTGDNFLYEAGKTAHSCIMVVEGNVEVLAGNEKLPFSAGPFTIFGAEFLYYTDKAKEDATTAAEANRSRIPKRDANGRGFRLSTFKRRQTIQLRRLDTIRAKPLPKPPIAFPKYGFIPDYSVRVTEETFYLEVDFRMYRAARAATQLERKYKTDPKAQVLKTGWRSEVEVELTIVEKDLRLKQRGRFVCAEAEDFESDDVDLENDVLLVNSLLLGAAAAVEEEQRKDFRSTVVRK